MKQAKLIIILCTLLAISGCGFKDLDKRFFVLAMGVDLSGNPEKPYKITIKLGIPSPKIEPGMEKTQILTEESDSITEAVRLLKSKVDKELDFGQTKMILFGEKLARKGIKQPLDWFDRRRDIQNVSYLAVGSPTAEKILRISPVSERLPGNALFLSFGDSGTESSYIVTEYLFDFTRRMYEKGLDPVMPVIEPLPQTFRVDKVALFDKEKLIKILSPNDTRVFNQLANQFQKFDLNTDTPDNKYLIAVQWFNMKYKIVDTRSGKPVINIDIYIKGVAEESLHPLFNKDWDKLERDTENIAEKRYLDVLKKIQKLKVDPVGFGLRYRATHYNKDAWETWESMYPDTDFKVRVHMNLKGTGVIK